MIQEIDNIKPFLELSDNALKFMSPQRAWWYPRADSYLFYSLKQAPPYNCSAPFWREIREEVFAELRKVVDLPTIFYLALVKHNERSLHLPTGLDAPSNHVYISLTNSGSIILTDNNQELSYYSACKDLGQHAPHLVPNWEERQKVYFKLEKDKAYLTGNKKLAVVLPEPNTLYFHVEYRDD